MNHSTGSNSRTRPPLIGITGRRGLAGSGVPAVFADAPTELYFTDFASSVAAVGGVPVLLSTVVQPAAIVAALDGLVLSGGPDVDPRRYGVAPGPHATELDPVRDDFELALVEAAWAARLPVLGICRGNQVINVARGGTLVPNLSPDSGEAHSFFGYPRDHRPQTIELVAGSVPHTLFGSVVDVNSFHHQAVAEPGAGLRVVGTAADGVVEAIEADDPDVPVLGVQWHPEFFGADPVFGWLVDRARTTDHRLDDHHAVFA